MAILKRPSLLEIVQNKGIKTHQKGVDLFISCPNPSHPDKNPSCQLNLSKDKQTFHCYSCGVHGDVFDFIALLEGVALKDVLLRYNDDKHTNLNYSSSLSLAQLANRYVYGLKSSGKIEEASQLEDIYPIYTADKVLFGAMLRLNPKAFLQTHIILEKGKEKLKGGLPLKGQKMLPFNWQKAEIFKKVIICEGQKAAKKLQEALGSSCAVLSLCGSTSLKKIDWSDLRDKDVYFFPDNDSAGKKCAEELKGQMNLVQPKSFTILKPHWQGMQEKDDAYDWVLLCQKEKKEISLEALLKEADPLCMPILHDFNEDGKPLETIKNFQALCQFYNIEHYIDVFKKEGGLYKMPYFQKLQDDELISLLALSSFPRNNRASFVECPLKKNPRYFSSFKNKLETLEPIALDQCYLFHHILDCFTFEESMLEHLSSRDAVLAKQFPKELKASFLEHVFRTWFCLVYYQGCVLDKKEEVVRTVLLFKGRQSIGKTRWFSSITPEGYFHEGAGLPQDNDEKDQLTQSLITEIGEFDSMSPHEMKKAKSFISTKVDKYRKKYGRETLSYPRVTTFVATTNRNNFFTDAENTRFWTLHIKDIDKERLNEILPDEEAKWRLWKEIETYFRFYGGVTSLFENVNELNKIFAVENEKYRYTCYNEILIENALDLEAMKKGEIQYYIKKKDLYNLISFGEMNVITSKEMSYAIARVYESLGLQGCISAKVKPYMQLEGKFVPLYVFPICLHKEDTERFNYFKNILYTK